MKKQLERYNDHTTQTNHLTLNNRIIHRRGRAPSSACSSTIGPFRADSHLEHALAMQMSSGVLSRRPRPPGRPNAAT